MVVLLDTNVLIDALANREPFAHTARCIIGKCAAHEITGVIAAHSFPDMFYILRRQLSQNKRRELLKYLCKIFYVSSLNQDKIFAALDKVFFPDFEDCLQDLCAKEASADYIITRNTADYSTSVVKAQQFYIYRVPTIRHCDFYPRNFAPTWSQKEAFEAISVYKRRFL